MFSSIDDIRKTFDIDSRDPKAIRRHLKSKLAALHPDNFGGDFESEEAKEEYNKLLLAIEYIDGEPDTSTSMVPVSVALKLAKEIGELNRRDPTDQKSSTLRTTVNESLASYKRSRAIPAYLLSAVTAILSAVWLFPSIVSEHPVLSQLVDIESDSFTGMWLTSLATTGFLWFMVQLQVSRQEQFSRRLELPGFQNELFNSFLRESWLDSYERQDGIITQTFSRGDLLGFVMRPSGRGRGLISTLFRATPSPHVAENVVDVILERMKSKGIIRKIDQPSIEDRFELLN